MYNKEFERILIKSLKTDCMIPSIKVGKSSFSVGNRTIQYDDFFLREINSDGDKLDYSIYALWFIAVSLQCLSLRESNIYGLIEDTIRSFANSHKIEERANFLKGFMTINDYCFDHKVLDCCSDESRHVVEASLFLRTTFKCFLCDNSTRLFMDVVFLYYNARDSFFKVFKICSGLSLYILDGVFDYFDHPKFKLPIYKFNGKEYSNSVGYNLSQALKLIVDLSDLVCAYESKDKENVDDMILFNDSRHKTALAIRYKDVEDFDFVYTKSVKSLISSLESGSLADDLFASFVKTGDFHNLIDRFVKEVKINLEKDYISSDELRCEGLARQLRVFNKKFSKDNLVLLSESLLNVLVISQETILNSVSWLFITGGYVNSLEEKVDSLNKSYEGLNEKYKMLKSSSKQSKRSVDEAKQSKLKSEQKATKLESELAKFKKESVSKSDFDDLESSYNALMNRIRVAEVSLKEKSDILDEKKAECSRLTKENKQLKSQILQVKGLLTELGITKGSEQSTSQSGVSIEEKIELINQFNTVIIGGMTDLPKSLNQLGYVGFTRCCEVSEFTQGSKYDLAVVCTNFCSHTIVNHAKCHLKGTDFTYFNNENTTILIDLVYNYYSNLLNA